MTTKANKQSKFMQYITTPIRIIGKARDFYMKTMFDCAGRIGQGSVVSCHAVQVSHIIPTKFDFSSSNVENDDEDDLRKLIRVVYKRELDRRMGSNVPQRQPGMGASGVGRSYSVGVGRIGRIDEDKCCDFEEEDVKSKGDMFNPRSRSYAVTKRNVVYY